MAHLAGLPAVLAAEELVRRVVEACRTVPTAPALVSDHPLHLSIGIQSFEIVSAHDAGVT